MVDYLPIASTHFSERFLNRRLFLLFAFSLPAGCARRQAAPTAPPPASAQTDIRSETYVCLQKVLKLPASDVASVSDDEQSANETFHIDTPLNIATDAERYSLHVNNVNQSAFITSAGGINDHIHKIYGPWSSTSPCVANLIRVVRSVKQDADSTPKLQ